MLLGPVAILDGARPHPGPGVLPTGFGVRAPGIILDASRHHPLHGHGVVPSGLGVLAPSTIPDGFWQSRQVEIVMDKSFPLSLLHSLAQLGLL